MMFMAQFIVRHVLSFLFLLNVVWASPLALTRKDVPDPAVLTPNASTVWVTGQTETVVWDTSNLPAEITNKLGTILLGFVNDTTGNEHLMIDNPLAKGFDITAGHVDIVVPDVEPRNDYVIALLGDSGNISPKFTITTATGQSTSVESTSSSATTSSVPSLSVPSAPVTTSTTLESLTTAIITVSSDSSLSPTVTESSSSAPSSSLTTSQTSTISSTSSGTTSVNSDTSSPAPTFTTTTSAGSRHAQISLLSMMIPITIVWSFL